jgi:hypothetical protein
LDIDKHVYDEELTVEGVAIKYDLSISSVKTGLRPKYALRKP